MSANKSSNFKNTEDGNGRDKGSAGANTKPSKPQQGVSIAVSSHALFDMVKERKIYEEEGLERYVAYQQKREDEPLKPGAAFQFVQDLLAMNTRLQELDSNCKKLFDVVLMSSNDTRVGLRLSNSIKKYNLDIKRFCLTGGESPVEYLEAYETKRYLSNDAENVKNANKDGIKAVLPTNKEMASSSETRNKRTKRDPQQKGSADPDQDAVTIVISSSALFNTDDDQQSVKPGAAFPFVKALMTVNTSLRELYPKSMNAFNIVLLHDDQTPSAEEKLRNSIETHGLEIKDIHSIDGNSPVPYLESLRAKLYLCMDTKRAKEAIQKDFAAAIMKHYEFNPLSDTQLRVAFDGDAVVFTGASEKITHQQGLQAFFRNEQENEDIPLEKGPLKCFLEALSQLQQKFKEKNKQGDCPIRTYLVTSRDGTTSGARVMKTLKSWGLQFDETHFLAGAPKGPVLEKIRPHIFFDDQKKHTNSAEEHGIIGAHVPYGIHNE